MTFGLNDVIVFGGKYKGKTISEVLWYDPSYIVWLDSKDIMHFEPTILEAANEAVSERNCAYGDPEDFFDPHY